MGSGGSIAWPKTVQPTHQRVVCLDFPAGLLRFGGHSRAIYEGLCSFEVLARHSGFRRRDELRNEFRGKVDGGKEGEIVGKGYRRAGLFLTTCSVEQRVITVKLLSRRKWPPIAPITVITANNTLDKETPMIRVCVHACMRVCMCTLCIYIYFPCVFSQHANPSAVFIQRFPFSTVGVAQVAERSLCDPVYFSWLGCASVPKLCWVSVAAVWMCSLQHWQTTGLMRSRFSRFRVRYWHPSRLSHSVLRMMCSFLRCKNEHTTQIEAWSQRAFVHTSERLSVRNFAYIHTFTRVYTHLSPHERITTDFDVTAPPKTECLASSIDA